MDTTKKRQLIDSRDNGAGRVRINFASIDFPGAGPSGVRHIDTRGVGILHLSILAGAYDFNYAVLQGPLPLPGEDYPLGYLKDVQSGDQTDADENNVVTVEKDISGGVVTVEITPAGAEDAYRVVGIVH